MSKPIVIIVFVSILSLLIGAVPIAQSGGFQKNANVITEEENSMTESLCAAEKETDTIFF